MDERAELEKRLTQVRRAMRDQGLQALLVYDSGRHNFLRMNYVAYLTDFISVGPQTMLVLPLEDEPVLYLAPASDLPRAREESFVPNIESFKELWSRLQYFRQGRTRRPRLYACRYSRSDRQVAKASAGQR